MGENIKVLGVGYSPFSLRVEIALKLKGVDYEFIEEDLMNKSEQLLKYNPIHKKVPVLIHNGKILTESLLILEYIDETWKHGYSLLPGDPLERAYARFWANFIDDKVTNAAIAVGRGKEELREKAREELKELLKIFENEVKGKRYLIGNEIGYLDLVAIIMALWFPVMLEAIDEDILSKDNYPDFWIWADHFLGCDIVQNNVPKREKLLAFYRGRVSAMRAANASPM